MQSLEELPEAGGTRLNTFAKADVQRVCRLGITQWRHLGENDTVAQRGDHCVQYLNDITEVDPL